MRRFLSHCSVSALLAIAPAIALAQDMPLSDVLIAGEGWQEIARGLQFTEGPAADAAGTLYFTDVPANRIYRLGAEGKMEVFVADSGAANGLMFGPDGRLYACQNAKKQIVAYDASGKESVIATGVESNDIVVSRHGEVYFTDPGNHRVWFVNRKGEKRVVNEGIERPNGLILWPDEGTLVVADTRGPHLWTFRVEADGALSHKQPYYTMRLTAGMTGSGADGMTVDASGRLYVATHAGVQMFDPTGRMGGVIAKPQNAFLSNVEFAGPERDWMVVTCTDKVYRRKTKAKGVRYLAPAAGK